MERIQTFPQHTNLTTTREKLSVVLLVKCRVSLLFLLFFLDLATSAADPRLHPTLPSTLLSPLMSLASPGLFPPCLVLTLERVGKGAPLRLYSRYRSLVMGAPLAVLLIVITATAVDPVAVDRAPIKVCLNNLLLHLVPWISFLPLSPCPARRRSAPPYSSMPRRHHRSGPPCSSRALMCMMGI